jgi:hypothetical protein
VTAGFGHGVDNSLPDILGNDSKLRDGKRAQVLRGVNVLEADGVPGKGMAG